MARGWESKEIESQIEAAEERASQAAKRQVSAAQIALEREIDSLNLSRTRVMRDLEASTNPRYREMLNRSLAFLDEKLASLQNG